MSAWTDNDRLAYLANAMCDHTISPHEVEELNEILARDADSCEFYVDLLNLEAELPWTIGAIEDGQSLHASLRISSEASNPTLPDREAGSLTADFSEFPKLAMQEAGAEAKGANQEAIGDLPKIEIKPASLSRRNKRFDSIHPQRHKFRFNTLSAVLTALAWIGFGFFMWLSTLTDDTRPEGDGVNVNFVARITGQYEHHWAESTRGIPPFAFLVPGERLNLVEGFIEITFYDGAVVVLEGPAELVIDSSGAGTLNLGKLTASVTQEAIGFTVQTPSAEIVDMGTAFGIIVDASGKARIDVFDGRVRCEPLVGSGARVISTGESVYVSTGGHVEVGLAVSRELFVVDIDALWRDQPRSPAGRVVAYYSFDGSDATDSSGNGLHGTLVDSDDNGTLVFTTDVPTAIGSGNSIHFNTTGGNDDHVTIATNALLNGTFESIDFTVMYWYKVNGVNEGAARMFQKAEGTGNLLIQTQGAGSNNNFRGRITGAAGDFTFGSTIAGTAPDDSPVWHHVAFVFDATAKTMTTYLDGSQLGGVTDISVTLGAGPQITNTPLIIGHTDFSYSSIQIDDFVLFDAPLTQSEIAAIANGTVSPAVFIFEATVPLESSKE